MFERFYLNDDSEIKSPGYPTTALSVEHKINPKRESDLLATNSVGIGEVGFQPTPKK